MKGLAAVVFVLAAGVAPSAPAAPPAAPDVVYPKLPAEAASAKDFTPKGWTVERKAGGDLNGDGVADLVLVLRDGDRANVLPAAFDGGAAFDTNPRLLAVVFAKAGGGWRLALENHTLIPRRTDPNLEEPLGDDGVAVVRGTLRVSLGYFAAVGGWTTFNNHFTFRWRDGRFELVGFESGTVARNTGEFEDVSVDFAGGRLKLTTGTVDSNARKVRWKPLPARPPRSLEEVGDGLSFDPRR